MKWTLPVAALLILGVHDARAQRAGSPADATVFIRLVGSVRAEFEEIGVPRQSVDIDRVEIGTGSGFVISPHGYVLTNEHVINNTEINVSDALRKARITLKVAKIEVCFSESASSARGGGPRCFDASVHSADANLDLAVLFISASDLPYVAFGDSDVLRSAQGVSALGYPFGRALEVGRVSAPDLVPEISTSQGSISALRADDAGVRSVLQINGIVNPGNSGGPVVDERGYAVGVVRARVKGDAGIAFAIPINQAKDFLESRGLDSLMPVRRLRLGAAESFERKGMALRLPEGINAASPFRSRLESVPESTDVALRIDRSVTPWTTTQLERTLLQTESFERLSIEQHQSQNATQPGGARLLIGRATGMAPDGGPEIAMQYGILDLGNEKLIARYVGSPEQVAYNESVLRGSLLSLEGQRLMSGETVNPASVEWAAGGLPLPVGWIIEPGLPSPCASLTPPESGAAAYPAGDVTLAVRRATWNSQAVSTQQAAASCSSRRGSNGDSSYSRRADWLGVSYALEGVFVREGSRLVQLEVISPEAKAPLARALLAASIKKIAGAK
jgi:S1-C subfamily serine protease